MTVAIAANALGAERVGVEKHRLRSVSALTVAAEASPWRMAFAAAETAEIAGGTFSGDAFSAPITPTVSGRLLAGHHATCILGALGVGLMDHSPDAFPAFAFGRASARERARLEGAGPAARARRRARRVPRDGPLGWRRRGVGFGLRAHARRVRDFGIGIGIGFGDVLDTRSRSSSSSWLAETASVLVSSALVACEAPALASPGFSASTRVGVLGAAGGGVPVPARRLAWVREQLDGRGGALDWPFAGGHDGHPVASVAPEASAFAVGERRVRSARRRGGRGGLSFRSRRRRRARSRGGRRRRRGGAVGAVSCVAPAGRPGRVAVAVVDAAPGAACDSGGYAAASGAWRRHRLDDWD